MFESLKHIQKKFPYFLDMTEDSNTSKVTRLLDDGFIDILDSLEKVRNGYFFLNNYIDADLTLKKLPAVFNEDNTVIFTTNKSVSGDLIDFNSSIDGYLGTSELTGESEGVLHEHITIKPETVSGNLKKYTINIYADDIQEVTIKNLTTGIEETVSFKKGENYYTHNIGATTDDYQIIVKTYNEYLYISCTNRYNPDLNQISYSYVGCTRRNYNNLLKTILVDAVVDTINGDNNNTGWNMKHALKSLRKALKHKTIGFIGSEKLGNVSITHPTTIIGNTKSELKDTYFWIEPNQKLTLKNLILNNHLITEQTVINTNNETILIGG